MSWWLDDPRYRQPGWTLVHDHQGSRFVEAVPRKRRAPSRNLRFLDLKAGTVLISRTKSISYVTMPAAAGTANDNSFEQVKLLSGVAICEDRWFDPVAGQADPLQGEMASVRYMYWNGVHGTKRAHTLRGLAQAGYHYATADQATEARRFIDEVSRLRAAVESEQMTMTEARLQHTSWAIVMLRMGLK